MWRGGAKWWFALGEALGGLATGFVVALVGSLVIPVLPSPVRLGLVALAAAAVVAHELGLIRLPLPQNARQVPPEIIRGPQAVGALQFGFEMGTGVRTFMTSALPHLLLAAGLLLGGFPWAAVLGLAFGVGRAIMPLQRMLHADPEAWDVAFARRHHGIRQALAVAAVLCIIAVIA